MREIRFRGKRKDKKEWVYGNYFITRYDNTVKIRQQLQDYSLYSHDVIAETVGQFTGLKDKNGKEIYEGDIVRVEKVDLAYIYYDEDRMAWGIKPINEFYFDSPLLSENVGLELEVIGNTYENKSLLAD